MGKWSVFSSKPRHVTFQNRSSQKIKPCSLGFNTHLWGFQGHRWEKCSFFRVNLGVTPQIDHLGKSGPVLRVSTHIYRISKELDVNIHF